MHRITIILICLIFLSSLTFAYAQDNEIKSSWSYCPYCGYYIGQQGIYGLGSGMVSSQGMMGTRGMYEKKDTIDINIVPEYYEQSNECKKFFEDTAELRKELHNKRFEYYEALRNPKIKAEKTLQLEKELQELQREIYSKKPLSCIW